MVMFETEEYESLRRIGLTPAVVREADSMRQAASSAEAASVDGTAGGGDAGRGAACLALRRVTEVQREGVTLHDGEAEAAARLRPALRVALGDEGDAVAVGDWVLAARNRFGEWWVAERVPPFNQLARRLHDGREKVERVVIVSNVDTALLVMGLDHDFSLRRLERYLALVRMAGVVPVVVLTKADLCDDAGARVAAARGALPRDAAVVALNALGDAPRRELAPWLGEGQTLVLLGSSGAGKSTLTNALAGVAVQRTQANRGGDSRGRHTTTSRSLHLAIDGACIIDTPGLRTLRLDGDATRLAGVFEDVAEAALRCRFRDCRHEHEPGCAVREVVAAERLTNWRKLQREAERDTLSALERKTRLAQWKVVTRAARARTQSKRG